MEHRNKQLVELVGLVLANPNKYTYTQLTDLTGLTYDQINSALRRAQLKEFVLKEKPGVKPTSKLVPQRKVKHLIPTPPNTKNVMVIGDLHEPFTLEGYREFCIETAKKYQVTHVIFIGDIIDNHYASFHISDPDGLGGGSELAMAVKHIGEWVRAFPIADVTTGNHDRIIMRKAFEGQIPRAWIMDYQDVLGAPGWNFVEGVKYDGVHYIHGEGATARTRARKDLMSTVQGHRHPEAYTEYVVGETFKIFGMQVGCVDMNTEYLTPQGWKKISDYDGGLVAQFNEDGTATFVQPLNYIVNDEAEVLHFRNEYGLDMKLSDNHNVVYKSRSGKLLKITAQEVARKQREHVNGFERAIPVSFNIRHSSHLPLTDDQLRLQVAFHADGTIKMNHGVVTLKKQRKIERLQDILDRLRIEYRLREYDDGTTRFTFRPPMLTKQYDESWYGASPHQLSVIAEESLLWDGDQKKRFTSKHKQDADFIQYAFVATGHRADIRLDTRKDKAVYDVTVSLKKKERFLSKKGGGDVPHETTPDRKTYCFTVPSGMLVLRSEDSVFITGNCGVDRHSYAMAYAKDHPKPAIGVGLILDHGALAFNVLMKL